MTSDTPVGQMEISRRDLKRIIKAGRRRQGLFNFDFGEPRWTEPLYLHGKQIEVIPMWSDGTVSFHTRNGKMIERFLPWQPIMIDRSVPQPVSGDQPDAS